MLLLTPATTTLCWTIHGEPSIIHMLQSEVVTSLSPGEAGIVLLFMAGMLRSQTHVLLSTAVALMPHCGFLVDTQQLRTESSLEMSVVTGTITAAILGLFLLKSKPVQAIITSMSWSNQLSVLQHTVEVIIFTRGFCIICLLIFMSHFFFSCY